MICYDVFRALNPNEDYPHNLFNVSISKLKFDLPLLPQVSDSILEVVTRSGNFQRVEKLSSPLGLEKIRSGLSSFDTENKSPAYAGCQVLEDISEPDHVTGYVLDLISVNESAARKILKLAAEGGTFKLDVDVWIKSRISYFQNSGGFEIARMSYYSDAEEKKTVRAFAKKVAFSDKSKSLVERSGHKLRFRDVVSIEC